MPGKKCIQDGRGICHVFLEAHFGHDLIPCEDSNGLISIGCSAIFCMILYIMVPSICALHLAASRRDDIATHQYISQ
jgi:hypothetical protein